SPRGPRAGPARDRGQTPARTPSARGSRRRSCGADRLDDPLVARAAAEVAAQCVPDLLVARRAVAGEEIRRRQDHPRRAEAALEPVVLDERALDRVQFAVAPEAFDGGDLTSLGLPGENRAALRRPAVDEDRAGPALARVAADVRACQAEPV